MRILVADDEIEMTEILKQAISRKGHSVDVAFDGNHAMELLKQNHYDVAFLDLTMPEMTGMEISEYLLSSGAGTVTVLVTAYPFIMENFLKASGIHEWIAKPFEIAQIDQILQKYSPSKGV